VLDAAVCAWLNRAQREAPPPSAVDAIAIRLATVLEGVALAGLQRIGRGKLTGEMNVIVERWPTHCTAWLLARHLMQQIGAMPAHG
jgi:hypothetical protein